MHLTMLFVMIKLVTQMKFIYSYSLFWRFARFQYILYRILLRIKIGKKRRDEYFRKKRISEYDFLPERTYLMESGVKAVPRRGTRDFQMLFVSREHTLRSHLVMQPDETFVDVGANVGSYSLDIAQKNRHQNVKVIAIEAHEGNYRALCRNIQSNNFEEIIKPIHMVVSNYKGKTSLYERSHDGSRVDSEMYSICKDGVIDSYNILHPSGNSSEAACDTLDNILINDKADVIKVDVEGAEIMVLEGATETMKRIRRVAVEIHGDRFEGVQRILLSQGFLLEEIKDREQMSYIIGTKMRTE
jgi:FkbM family methyltransferase